MKYRLFFLCLIAGVAQATVEVRGGGVSSVTAGTGLSGGTITETGTMALSTPVAIPSGGTGAATAATARTALGVPAAATTISTTAPLTGGGDLSANRTIAIPAATSSVDGYLTHADWATLNSKQAAVSATAPVTFTSNTVALPVATSSVDGYIAHGDWTTFNSKQPAISNMAGSVLFSGGGSAVSEDNANFFYDGANHRIGIGTTTPTAAVDVYNGNIRLRNQGSGGGNPGYVEFDDTTGNNIKIEASATSASYTIQLPDAGATQANQPLCSGAGAGGTPLSWCDPLTSFITSTTLYQQFSYLNAAQKVVQAYCGAADGNQDISGGSLGPTCDGVDMTFGGVFILNAQTDPTENGVWQSNAAQAWVRVYTMPDNTGSCDNRTVAVQHGGTNYGNTIWQSQCDGSGAVKFVQLPSGPNHGTCTVASTTLSTTATNLTCTGVPASSHVAVRCSGQAAFSTATANGLYCRATGTVDQIACNTTAANTTAMAYSCDWTQP